MGVPKFFRWLSERYPKINQRAGFLPEEETCVKHFGHPPPDPLIPPDPLSTCGLPPPIDRLYIDMNGIIHGCSHNNNSSNEIRITQEEVFQNIAYYLDRIVGDIVQPSQLVYLSIDGVAPRAKLNQQRSRRYRSGNEGEIEETIYEAHYRERPAHTHEEDHATENDESNLPQDSASHASTTADESLEEVEPGRFTGKFESHADQIDTPASEDDFHHNAITPGTQFFQECTDYLEAMIEDRLANDPKWQGLTVIFSGPNVPGEGEHKIMDFIRKEKLREDYDVNTRHCIMGQDGDWIMLGLATHEPNLVLLREQVVFEQRRQHLIERNGIASYIHNCNFEWLHMGILRDYLAYEFETSNVVPSNNYDLEATIDDFVFLTFFVGNDFLPHMPALDIADEAFDLLFYTYRKQRKGWQSEKQTPPYLTHAGNIVSGKRLELFVQHLGGHEFPYYDNKKRVQSKVNAQMRKSDTKHGREPTIPEDYVLESKEQSDRAKYRDMLSSVAPRNATDGEFSPVLSKRDVVQSFRPSTPEEDDVMSRMSSLLQFSVKGVSDDTSSSKMVGIDDQDLKGRYYYDKFGFTPFDAEKHIALRKAYIEGLVWTLKYYYEGCVSWDFYYPYHYGPMLSDLVNIDEMLAEVSFTDKSEPLRPFEQLMGCMPPSSSYLLPKPYRWLLTESSSPLVDFYPRTFTVDMNGKRWPWEAVVLLPFIDSERLVTAARTLVTDNMLTEEERKRNKNGHAWVFATEGSALTRVPLQSSQWYHQPEETAVLRPEVAPGTQHPQPGFPTLKEVPIQSLWRRNVGINVFGMRSRYRTALLVLGEVLPISPPIETLGKTLIGTTIFVDFPFLTEAFVTAVSNSDYTMRGISNDSLRRWEPDEALLYKQKSSSLKRKQAFGEKLTGTGGWMMPDNDVTVSVRPLKGLKTLSDGSKARVYAKFEVEIPLTAAIWTPSYEDSRLSNAPALMEKDPYYVAVETKKRKPALLPQYEEVDATEQQPTGEILPPGLEESDPYAPPLILPAFEDQDPPVMHPLHEDETASPRILPEAPSGSSQLPQRDHITPLVSRGFATSSRPLRFHDTSRVPGKRSFSTAHRLSSTRVATSNPRSRLFALSVATAAALVVSSSTADASLGKVCHFGQKPGLLGTLVETRGGNQETVKGDNIANVFDDVSPPPLEFAHGTTTLSFIFDGGIVAAVDSRASLGNFVGSKTTQKVLPVNSHILGTMAGGAADCNFWIRKLKAEAQFYELKEGQRMSVARASRILANALYANRALNLSVGTMIMGFDPNNGGPRIYYVDNTGVRIKGDLFAVGSGSTFALGILDTERRTNMTEEEAIALGIKAIRHATFRDAFSGGYIAVYVINKEGWRKVFSEDLARSPRDEYKEELSGPDNR